MRACKKEEEPMSKYDRYWEMTEGGPYDKGQGEQVFKCTECGAVTFPDEGWNGAPDTCRCSGKCQESLGSWSPGVTGSRYRENFDEIFPDAPGAGI